MDDVKRVFDVSKPGGTAATPSSRPTIVTNSPTISDPMFTSAPANPIVPATPETPAPSEPIAPAAPTPSTEPVQPVAPMQPAAPTGPQESSAELVHKLAHEEAFYGHVKKPSKLGKRILFVVLVLIFAAAGYAAWMYRQNQGL